MHKLIGILNPPPGFRANPLKAIAMIFKTVIPALIGSFLFIGASAAADVDADAAQALAKKSGCLKCHAIDKKRDAPAFKATAAKYKGKAGAEDTLYKHLTTSPKVKVDGVEETHDSPKTKDEKEIRNLVRWILTR